MASVKISELNTLISITSDDFFALVDSGSGTTYRTTFNVLNNWMAASASCFSASYALSSSWAVSASYALSSSWANNARSSSYALTASFYDLAGYAPAFATSASFAATASSLQGNGTSWEQTLKISRSLTLASGSSLEVPRMVNRIPVNPLLGKANSIFFNTEYGGGVVNDYAKIYYMESPVDSGRLLFDISDDIVNVYGTGIIGSGSGESPDIETITLTESGFLFSGLQSNGYFATASLFFIGANGKIYGRGFEARDYSQSLVNQVGFHGTASHAITASYLIGSGTGGNAPIGAIMDFAGTGAPADTNWALCDGSELSQAGYPTLYILLGTTWGVASPGNFKLPDLRKRFTLGAGTTSDYLGNVGDTGGSENLNSHYHLIGKTVKGIYGDGSTRNDDVYFVWVNDQSVNMDDDFPATTSPNGSTHAGFLLTGDDSHDRWQPKVGLGTTTNNGFIIGTSFGFVVGTNGSSDINPPYAVCNKIIRIA